MKLKTTEEIRTMQTEELFIYLNNLIYQTKKERDKIWIDKFDKYACIKNDKWYLDWKEELLKFQKEIKPKIDKSFKEEILQQQKFLEETYKKLK